MRLKPDEFNVTPANPYEPDRLDRVDQVDALCRVVETVDGHAVIMVDAPWGSGKTAFLKMCAATLRRAALYGKAPVGGFSSSVVIEFNAWRQSYTGDPLVDLIAVLNRSLDKQIGRRTKRRLANAARNLVFAAAQKASFGIVDLGSILTSKLTLLDPWIDAHDAAIDVEKQLTKIGQKVCQRIVILIDEVDRSSPTYALRLLEVVRNLLDVDGVVTVLTLNKEQLCHAIHSTYGPAFDADRFLQRFADIRIGLRPSSMTNKTALMASWLDEMDIAAGLRGARDSVTPAIILLLAELPGRELRDLERMVQHFRVLAHITPLEVDSRDPLGVNRQTAVTLLLLREADPAAYADYCAGVTNGYIAAERLRTVLGWSFEAQSERIAEAEQMWTAESVAILQSIDSALRRAGNLLVLALSTSRTTVPLNRIDFERDYRRAATMVRGRQVSGEELSLAAQDYSLLRQSRVGWASVPELVKLVEFLDR